MGNMKQYILFNVLWISFMLWTALDRTLSASYFGDHQSDAALFWWGSILMLIVFSVGLYQGKKARQADTLSSGKAYVALLISILSCGVLVVFHVQKVLERIPAPQVPLVLKVCFALLTVINFGAWLWWTSSIYQEWRSQQNNSVRPS